MTAMKARSLDNTDCDLLIVGAGLVGAALAVAVSRRCPSLRILLLDAGGLPEMPTSERFDSRVVALNPGSRQFLEALGAWQTAGAARACPYHHMHVWDADGTGAVNFHCDDLHLPELGHIVENNRIATALHGLLDSCANVDRRMGTALQALQLPQDGEPVIAIPASGEPLTSRLLLAADGARSPVRAMADFHTREWDYRQSAIVTTVRTEKSHGHTAWQRFMTTGPLAFLPLIDDSGDTTRSSIVWSVDNDEAQALMALSDADFRQTLERAFERRLGAILGCDTRHCLPLHQRHATDYWQPGVGLLGDAAHSIHPLAGQGVNLGFSDARVLSEEIARAVERGVNLSDPSLLKRYERRRQGQNLAAMVAMEAFKQVFGREELPVRWLRNTGLSYCDHQQWLKNRLAALALG